MYKKVLALILATVLISGCDIGGESSESSHSAPADTQSSCSVATSESIPVSTQTTSSVKPNTPVDKMREQVYVDYEFIEDPDTLSRGGEFDGIAEKALDAVAETDDFKYFRQNYGSSEDAPVDEYWLSDGSTPAASVDRIYKDDFDNNGTEEYFALVSFPVLNGGEWRNSTHIVYVGETAEVVASSSSVRGAALLDYGFCKQLAFNGYRNMDPQSNSHIVGVVGGEPRLLYSLGVRIYKLDCFVTTFGMNGTGDFMIYDNVNGEYRAIMGEDLTAEEIYDMDKTDSLADRRGNIKYAVLLCEKYYMILKNNQDTGQAFTYENGTFTRNDTKGLRISLGTTENTIKSVNYDAAIGAMLTPEQARQLT